MRRLWLALAFAATPAVAEDRALCSDRPGLGTPACTVQPGKIVIETALADWTLDKSGDDRIDTVLIGDTFVRIGVAERVELQVGWTPLGYQRERSGGMVRHAGRVGDVTLGAKVNFAQPDGSGFSIALQPQVTLPVGRAPIGAGDWRGSVILPFSYEVSDTVQLQASPELDAAVDEDGNGRHAAYGGTVGLGLSLTDDVNVAFETQLLRDRDPAMHTTQAYGGVSAAWQTGRDFQVDAGANVGLNQVSDNLEFYAGFSKRF